MLHLSLLFILEAILTTQEKMGMGTVKSYIYHIYVKSAGGYFIAVLVFLTLFLNIGSSAFSSWWLAIWIKAGNGVNIFSYFNCIFLYFFFFFFFINLSHLRILLIPIIIKLYHQII